MNPASLVVVVWTSLWPGACRPLRAEEGDRARLITVTSPGEVRVKPDAARLLFAVAGQASSITEAQAAHDKLLGEVKAKLSQSVGQGGKIDTSAFDIRTVQTNYSGRAAAPSTVGFRVSSDLDLVVDLTQLMVNRLAELASAAVEAGATLRTGPGNVYRESSAGVGPSFVVFELKEAGKHKLEALRRAVLDAGPKAEAVAKALGAKLGKVQSVQIGSERVFSSRREQYEEQATASQWADIVVQAGVTINYVAEF